MRNLDIAMLRAKLKKLSEGRGLPLLCGTELDELVEGYEEGIIEYIDNVQERESLIDYINDNNVGDKKMRSLTLMTQIANRVIDSNRDKRLKEYLDEHFESKTIISLSQLLSVLSDQDTPTTAFSSFIVNNIDYLKGHNVLYDITLLPDRLKGPMFVLDIVKLYTLLKDQEFIDKLKSTENETIELLLSLEDSILKKFFG